MNLILFEQDELEEFLPFDDPRAVHITTVLGLKEGEPFAAGIVSGQRGSASLASRCPRGWRIQFVPVAESPPAYPITVVLGCPRPPVARRLLKDLSTLGVREIRVCSTELNEKSYLSAKLWRGDLWRKALLEGGMQGVSTLIPAVRTAVGLSRALEGLPVGDSTERIAFDCDGAASPLAKSGANGRDAILAIGPERGWTDKERELLIAHGFTLTRLGRRILRTETACTVGVGLILGRWGIY